MPETALNKAMYMENWIDVNTLLNNGADPNEVGVDGRNALHVAVIMCDDRAVFQRILEGINDINAADNEGNTALIIAALKGYVLMVTDILKKPHIDINLRDNTGHTALDYANLQNHQNIVSLLTNLRGASRLMDLKNKLRF